MDVMIGAIIFCVVIISAVVVAPTVKMAVGIAPFLYTNTRCSAKSGLILKRKAYDGLLASTYVNEVYAELEETAYSHVAEHAGKFDSASELLDKDLHDTYAWLENIMPESVRPIIAAMRRKFEVQQIKEAMNSVSDGQGVGELPHVTDANVRLKLEEATDLESIDAALEGTPYGAIVDADSLSVTELDRHYLGSVLDTIESCSDKKAAEPFRDYWRKVIDFANIRLALRRINGESSAKMVGGGLIPKDKLANCMDRNQLAEALQGTPYESIDVHEAGLKLERRFLEALREEGSRSSAKHPLKGGPIVNFLVQKELEVRNLNIILKLKAEGFKTEEINDLLVVGA